MVDLVIFVIAAVLCLGGALGVIVARNPVHSALFLVQTLLAVAIFFLMQDAQLVAAVQVIVYASAIVVLFLFVIMLLGVDRVEDEAVGDPLPWQRVTAPLVVALGTAALVLLAGRNWATGARAATEAVRGEPNVETVAKLIFTDYVWAFELVSVLLVVAVVGGVVVARRGLPREPFRTEADALADAGEQPLEEGVR